jgi:radical SAM enzyme (TIGR01210 family)
MTALESIREEVVKANLRARGNSLIRRKSRSPSKPAAKWTASARVAGSKGIALSIVLSTLGCSHARGDTGGCTMCSYLLDGSGTSPTADQLVEQVRNALNELDGKNGPFSVKIYTSGSFLDSSEVPEKARIQILELIGAIDEVREVVLETRPEYVTDAIMTEVRGLLGSRVVELGIGLETSNDAIRALCINKNFDYSEFKEAVETARKQSIGVRAYVLLKPPFLTESQAIEDVKHTIDEMLELEVTTISINPVNIQKNTLVEYLWNRRKYRPPWLWSVVEVLKHAADAAAAEKKTVNIVCDPAAAGKIRGTHNCPKCDAMVISAIRSFSLDNQPKVLDALDCDCKALWRHTCIHEDVSQLVHR